MTAQNLPLDETAFVEGYTQCMLWSENDEADESGGEPIDQHHSASDIPEDDRLAMEADCRDFIQSCRADLEAAVNREGYDSSRAGHDFWLTRQGHGAGYWDRNELKEDGLGQRITEACHTFGEHHEGPQVDDGKVYYGRSREQAQAGNHAVDTEAREAAIQSVTAALEASVNQAYDCTKVWGAWGVGTMTADNFSLIHEDGERLNEMATEVVDAVAGIKASYPSAEAMAALVRETVSSALGTAVDCTQPWSAWNTGTMTEQNFVLVRHDPARLDELTAAVLQALQPHMGVRFLVTGETASTSMAAALDLVGETAAESDGAARKRSRRP